MLNDFYVSVFVILEWVWICCNNNKEHELKKSKEDDTESGSLEAMAPAMAKYSYRKFYPCLVRVKAVSFHCTQFKWL